MKVRYLGETNELMFINQKVYEVISIEKVFDEDWYRIIDETEEDYLYPADELFEIVEE